MYACAFSVFLLLIQVSNHAYKKKAPRLSLTKGMAWRNSFQSFHQFLYFLAYSFESPLNCSSRHVITISYLGI